MRQPMLESYQVLCAAPLTLRESLHAPFHNHIRTSSRTLGQFIAAPDQARAVPGLGQE